MLVRQAVQLVRRVVALSVGADPVGPCTTTSACNSSTSMSSKSWRCESSYVRGTTCSRAHARASNMNERWLKGTAGTDLRAGDESAWVGAWTLLREAQGLIVLGTRLGSEPFVQRHLQTPTANSGSIIVHFAGAISATAGRAGSFHYHRRSGRAAWAQILSARKNSAAAQAAARAVEAPTA